MKDTDNTEDYLKQLASVAGKKIHVGILGDSTIATYAVANEFGTSRIPERSFLRTALDEHSRTVLDHVGKIWDLTQNAEKVLESIGLEAQTAIVEKINSNIGPPLKPATIQRKGSSHTLIDTARLKQAVTFEVVGG